MDGNIADIGHGVEDALNLQQQDADFRFQQLVANGIFDQAVAFLDDIQDQINADIPAVNAALEDQLNANLAAANAAIAEFDNMLEEISLSEDSGYSGSVSELSDVSHFSSFSDELRHNEQRHFGFVVHPEHVARADMYRPDVHEPVPDGREVFDNIAARPPDDISAMMAYYHDAASNTSYENGEERASLDGFQEIIEAEANVDSNLWMHDERAERARFEEFLQAERVAKVDIIQWMHSAETSRFEEFMKAERAANVDMNRWMHNAETSRFEEFMQAERAAKTDIIRSMHRDGADRDVPSTSRKRKREMVECLEDHLLTKSQSDSHINQSNKRRKLMGVKKSSSVVYVTDRDMALTVY